jgi:mannose-6-phosphate isomerase-like protein (cupin superfamily)
MGAIFCLPRYVWKRAESEKLETMITKVNLAAKLSLFTEQYSPKIIGEVNDLYVKVVKLQGEFVWHHHENEDELFYVIKGALRMKVREDGRENEFMIMPGEFIVIPRGVEHLPSAEEETHIMLLEPKTTLNTGNLVNERTVQELDRI